MHVHLSVPCTNVNVQEKKRLVQDLEKIPAVEQTGFTTAFRVSKKGLRICACFENQELLNVFMILHSINSCTFNLQVFLIRREKVTLDLRGLYLSKGKNLWWYLEYDAYFEKSFWKNICLSNKYSNQLCIVSKGRSRNYFRKDVMSAYCPGVSVLTETVQVMQIIKYTSLLLQITFLTCICNPDFICWLKRMMTLEYLHSELC